jgi:hypothetical protein
VANYVFEIRMQYYCFKDEKEIVECFARKYTDEHSNSIKDRKIC